MCLIIKTESEFPWKEASKQQFSVDLEKIWDAALDDAALSLLPVLPVTGTNRLTLMYSNIEDFHRLTKSLTVQDFCTRPAMFVKLSAGQLRSIPDMFSFFLQTQFVS